MAELLRIQIAAARLVTLLAAWQRPFDPRKVFVRSPVEPFTLDTVYI